MARLKGDVAMGELRLSVAMCTYNGSRHLEEQLRSITSQQRIPDEMVVCDDGSSDETVRMLASFAGQAAFPVHIHMNSSRLGAARNFGQAIGLCQGDVIALSDQDDIWKPSKLATLVQTLERHPDAAYAFSEAEIIDGHGMQVGRSLWGVFGTLDKVKRFSPRQQMEILLNRNLVTGATMAFRASLKSILLPIPSGWMHDYWIALLGSAFSYGVPVWEPLIKYRQHASQVCFRRSTTYLQWYRRMLAESLETNPEDVWEKIERFRMLRERVLSAAASPPCPARHRELIEEKAKHLERRAVIRSSRGLSRILGVFAEVSSGRYRRFSRSWRSVVRDL